MTDFEESLSAEQRLKDWLNASPKDTPYPGFRADLEHVLARLDYLRAQNARLRVKAKEA